MNERPRKPPFEGEMTIVIQGRRGEDGVLLGLGLAVLALILWLATATILGWDREDNGLSLMMAVATPFVLWTMVGPFRRLRDRRPFFVAAPRGLRLHPGFWPRDLAWPEIRSLSIQTERFIGPRGGRSSLIRILLQEKARSSAYPFGTREIRVPLRKLGLSTREAADLLRQLREIRVADREEPV